MYVFIYLSIYPSIHPSVRSFVRSSVSIPIEIGPTPPHTNNTHPYSYHILPLSLLKLGWNDSGPKRPRVETTHLLRPKRPTPKIGLNDPGRNDPAETTRIPWDYTLRSWENLSSFYIQNFKPIPSSCGCASRFEPTLVTNPKDSVFSWRGS